MAEQPYKRPPITEAVIEIRFAEPLDPADIGKVSSALGSQYPNRRDIQNFGLQVSPPPPGTRSRPAPQVRVDEQSGQRRTTDDVAQLVLLWPSSFVVAQLAPYPGWDGFFERFARDWRIVKRAIGYRRIVRVGVRYINRIDVPASEAVILETDYLAFYPTTPDSLGPFAAYGLQAQFPLTKIGCNLRINSASVPSPLLGHISLVLDIDIGRETEVPQSDDEIFAFLTLIRTEKNAVFESCITERSRELFRK